MTSCGNYFLTFLNVLVLCNFCFFFWYAQKGKSRGHQNLLITDFVYVYFLKFFHCTFNYLLNFRKYHLRNYRKSLYIHIGKLKIGCVSIRLEIVYNKNFDWNWDTHIFTTLRFFSQLPTTEANTCAMILSLDFVDRNSFFRQLIAHTFK